MVFDPSKVNHSSEIWSRIIRHLLRRGWRRVALILSAIFFLLLLYKLRNPHSSQYSSLNIELEGFTPVYVGYRELIPLKMKWTLTVVLLYESKIANTWEYVGTPKFLQESGFRVVSLTMPLITNKPPQAGVLYPFKGRILMETLKKLKITDAVLVVPTYTGSFGLPVVVRGNLPLKGFVPIAPIDTEFFTVKEYKMVKTPTLIVFGRNDEALGQKAYENLKFVKEKEVLVLEHAGQDCYVERPEEFHTNLIGYLRKIEIKNNIVN